jgi:hypothetical protein
MDQLLILLVRRRSLLGLRAARLERGAGQHETQQESGAYPDRSVWYLHSIAAPPK